MTQVPPRFMGGGGWEPELEDALGLLGRDGFSHMPLPEVISTGLPDLIVPFPNRQSLWSLSPDLSALADFCRKRDIISVHCVTLDTLDQGSTAHCRDFSPAVGVPEEAATGTASGATAAYLVRQGLVDPGGADLVAMTLEQGHILDRPSTIYAEADIEEGQPIGIRVGGEARVVIDGVLRI